MRNATFVCVGAVFVSVVALNGVVNGAVDPKAAPVRGAVCVRSGAKARVAVSGRGLVCVRTKAGVLRWQFQPKTTRTTTPATTPTSTTVKQPKKNKPTETTVRKPGVADPDLIIDNGYYNIEGVRVVGNELGNRTVQKCGEILGYNPKGLGSGRVKMWFQYADGRISNGEYIFYATNEYVWEEPWGQIAHRSVFVMSDGIGYGEAGFDENGEFIKTNWIYCRNNPPITPEDFLP